MRFTFAKKTTLFRREREPLSPKGRGIPTSQGSPNLLKIQPLESIPLFSGYRYSSFFKAAQVDAPPGPNLPGAFPAGMAPL